ncbi:hypothetical protein KIPB_008402 [Kipferlia bialata]|uniref:Uncharacterized protein n=1 Tax=Kipferlia bialata TaxID=797122 RepID=A0A9K3D2Q7_9EUKA|nr:hypothetical protein KIPB_008402 [Kipferlia bialata]|eukprot:g8402.t1
MDSIVWSPINPTELRRPDRIVQIHPNKAPGGRRLILVRRLSDGTYTEKRLACPFGSNQKLAYTVPWEGHVLAICPLDRVVSGTHSTLPLPKTMHILHPDTLEWDTVPLHSDPPVVGSFYGVHYVVNDTWHMLGRTISPVNQRAWVRLHIPTRTWLTPLPALHMYDTACTYGETAYLVNGTARTLEVYTEESGFTTIAALPYPEGNDYTRSMIAYERHVVIRVVVHSDDDTDEVVGEQYYCLSLVSRDWKKVHASSLPGIYSGVECEYDPVIEWDADLHNASVSSVYMSGCVPQP